MDGSCQNATIAVKSLTNSRLQYISGIRQQEKFANPILEVSTHGYVLETGKVILEGPSAELKANPEVQAAYLGI